ncbi:hypothetical protein NPN17_24570, partial [Vibrio parahaemolyticus]|nr:hypothetical protein [Vibrio parahaemolyticus]
MLNAFALALGLGCSYATLSVWHRRSRRSRNPDRQGEQDRKTYTERYELHNRPNLYWHDLYA